MKASLEQSSPLSHLTIPGKGQEKARKCFENWGAIPKVKSIYFSDFC